MDPEPVLFDIADDVCAISLNRPAKRNAVDRRVATALQAAFERFEADAALKVAVLTGRGGHLPAATATSGHPGAAALG
ncbi:MAG: hypothetical protein KGK09_14875 [Burkholderiales bacterium]|nr:hypothetical protein [Burkholderiales bacterium]